MTFVKICGLTKIVHVDAAIQAGADFIGFMFASSKREIRVEQAVEAAKIIPKNVKKVGVFVNAKKETIEHIAQRVGLDYIQYHGDETPEFIAQIGLPSIKAFSIQSTTDVEKAAGYEVDYYLFDAPVTEFRGGSGHSFDWSLLKQVNIPLEKVILAGGLRVENISQAIEDVKPFAVDVSSGVEREGQKDSKLIEQFIQTAKGAKIS